MKIWAMTEEFKEGKYLVVRRDGTIPVWPHFVLSARDPAAPEALRAYANRCASLRLDPDYRDSVWDLAREFETYGRSHSAGDPDAPPHRVDNSFVISCMRHESDLTGIGNAPPVRKDIEYQGALSKIVQLAATALENGEDVGQALQMILTTAQDAQRAPEPVLERAPEVKRPTTDSGLSI
jgi:hypothetical protein